MERIVQEVLAELTANPSSIQTNGKAGSPVPPPFQPPRKEKSASQADGGRMVCQEAGVDITSPDIKAVPLLEAPQDRESLERMMRSTPARIGVGRAGPRLKTQTLLT